MPPILHSELGASSTARWMRCPASVRLSRVAADMEVKQGRDPNKGSIYANEGSVAHSVCERLLLEQATPDELLGTVERYGGDDIEINQTMIDAALLYRDTVLNMCGDKQFQVEQRFSLDWVYPGMFGTCDCTCYDPETRSVIIFDFKYGRGHIVSAEKNTQLLYYAAGVVGHELARKVDNVRLVIVQPRSPQGSVSVWDCTGQYLTDWVYRELLPAALATEKEDAPFCPGDEQCRWCRATPICPAMYKKSMAMVKDFFPEVELESTKKKSPIAEAVEKITLPAADRLNPEQVSKVLAVSAILSEYFDAVKESALDRMKAGETIPGYKLVHGRSIRTWADEEEAENVLVATLGEELAYEKKLISPTKAEKLVDKRIISNYISIPEGKLTVVPETDKRKSVSVSEIPSNQAKV